MTPDEITAWVRSCITTGFVDPRTHEHSCREVVTYCREHPEDGAEFGSALSGIVSRYEWDSPEQFENAAYLTVNLGNFAALKTLIERTSVAADSSRGASAPFITLAIAAIRSFPDERKIARDFLPELLNWLGDSAVAQLAFETLCDLSPQLSGLYLSMLAHNQSSAPEVLKNALTHLYFRGGNTEQGGRELRSAFDGLVALHKAVGAHPLIPADIKSRLSEIVRTAVGAAAPLAAAQPTKGSFGNLSLGARQKSNDVQKIIRRNGSLWQARAAA